MIIAIDGPAGAGKTSTARAVAERLGFCYMDTGAMYRAITFALIKDGGAITERRASSIINKAVIDVRYMNGRMAVYLDGTDVTDHLRDELVTDNVSLVSSYVDVRSRLVELQRTVARQLVDSGIGVVIDGRDIGTVVFPDADVKFFMSASPEVRAKRRYMELVKKGQNVSYEHVLGGVTARDTFDSQRKIAPLRRADDSFQLDTGSLSFEEQVLLVIQKVKERSVEHDV